MDDHGWSVYGFPGVLCLRICLGLRELGPETMTSSDRMPAPPGCGGGVKTHGEMLGKPWAKDGLIWLAYRIQLWKKLSNLCGILKNG